jgi:S1-C subfamily serine protease
MGGAAVGIGFAIPSDTVTSIARQLVTTRKVANSGRGRACHHGRDRGRPQRAAGRSGGGGGQAGRPGRSSGASGRQTSSLPSRGRRRTP